MDKKKFAVIDKEVIDLSVNKAMNTVENFKNDYVKIKNNMKMESKKLNELSKKKNELKMKVQKVQDMQKEINVKKEEGQ